MAKMFNLGESPKEAGMEPMKTSEKKVWYPGLHLDAKQLPSVKNLNVGDTGTMIIKYKVKSKEIREGSNNNAHEVGFDLMSAGIQNKNKSETKKFTTEIIKTLRSK